MIESSNAVKRHARAKSRIIASLINRFIDRTRKDGSTASHHRRGREMRTQSQKRKTVSSGTAGQSGYREEERKRTSDETRHRYRCCRGEKSQGTSTYVARARVMPAHGYPLGRHLMRTGEPKGSLLEFMPALRRIRLAMSPSRASPRALANFSLDVLPRRVNAG